MIRILFIILAVIAGVMAVLLPHDELYYLAGALLLVALVLVVASLAKRRRRHKKERSSSARVQSPPSAPPEDDLTSLGILEIKPKGAGSSVDKTTEETASREEDGSPAPQEEPSAMEDTSRPSDAAGSDVKERPPNVQAVDAELEAPRFAEVVGPYLQALRAALDAQTVCLLKQRDLALKYDIEAIVSRNAYARSNGHFATRAPLLNASEARKPVTLRRVGSGGMSPNNLGYYREAIAVRQVALAPVPSTAEPEMHFLLADAMQEGVLSTSRNREVLAQFATLLGMLMEKPPREDAMEPLDEVRPRRDIIAEEMEKARAKRRPLALGMVYLNQAEARADEGEKAVAEAEEALEAEVRSRIGRGRVERFGELTFGIFLNRNVAEVESWSLELQRDLADAAGPLEGGISMGFAMLQDRHVEVDDFRADATAALHEGYRTHTCVILE